MVGDRPFASRTLHLGCGIRASIPLIAQASDSGTLALFAWHRYLGFRVNWTGVGLGEAICQRTTKYKAKTNTEILATPE